LHLGHPIVLYILQGICQSPSTRLFIMLYQMRFTAACFDC